MTFVSRLSISEAGSMIIYRWICPVEQTVPEVLYEWVSKERGEVSVSPPCRIYRPAHSCSHLRRPSNEHTASLVVLFDIMQSTTTFQYAQVSLLLSTVCLAIMAAVGHSIHNRYLHPLRRQPGPIWAILTDSYNFYALWAKHIPTSQLALHNEYGMLF